MFDDQKAVSVKSVQPLLRLPIKESLFDWFVTKYWELLHQYHPYGRPFVSELVCHWASSELLRIGIAFQT